METTHRCILRCLTQLGFEAFAVATTLSIASCVGSDFPCDVFFASEGKTTSKKTVFLFNLFFFLTTFEFTNRLREKKRAELNQTALSVVENFTASFGHAPWRRTPSTSGFFPELFHKLLARGRRRSVPGRFTAFVRVISTFRPISVCNQV